MTIHALLLPSVVFIALGVIQLGAISTILVYTARYRGLVCPTHALNPAHEIRSISGIDESPSSGGRSAAARHD